MSGGQPAGTRVQALRFLLVGATGFAINVGTFALAYRVLDVPYQVAVVLAFVVGAVWSFTVHRAWTFEATEGDTGGQAARFLVVALGQTVLGVGLTTLFVELLTLDEHPSEALSAVVIAPITFLAHRVWTFLVPAAPLLETEDRPTYA